MAHLIYATLMSLDGYIEDAKGDFDWAAPDEEVHRFINDLERPVGTHLYGRRMYETLKVWETDPTLSEQSSLLKDYATIWQAAEKIVFSKTLKAAVTRKTRILRDFDPEMVVKLKKEARQDILVGGAELAAQAFKAGLIDELQLFLAPILVGNGKRALPAGVRLELALIEERRFENGMVYLRYRVGSGMTPEYSCCPPGKATLSSIGSKNGTHSLKG
jgi:dihydrofolate reductase